MQARGRLKGGNDGMGWGGLIGIEEMGASSPKGWNGKGEEPVERSARQGVVDGTRTLQRWQQLDG